MARFRLSHYVRTTFDADWRTFRLCGMDEVGRGAFAGPLVAAAVVLPPRFRSSLVRDSKQLSPAQRERAAELVERVALASAVVEVSAADINRRGLGWANVEAFRQLVGLLEADGYCCDGRLRIDAARPVHTLIGGDALVPAVSAASVIAKVHRDHLMATLHDAAPQYDWARNKGYGAPEHRRALRQLGPHPEHRSVFVNNLLQLDLPLAETPLPML